MPTLSLKGSLPIPGQTGSAPLLDQLALIYPQQCPQCLVLTRLYVKFMSMADSYRARLTSASALFLNASDVGYQSPHTNGT